MTEFLYTTLLLVAVALVVTLVTVPLASKIAWKVGSVDYPSMRRVNTKPTPRMGGIAVFMGIAAAYAVWVLFATPLGLPSPDVSVSGDINLWGVALSVAVMFIVGIVDDAIQLTALNKFFWQIVAACIAVASGVVIGDIVNPLGSDTLCIGAFAYPLTVLVLVSFANIINLIDGVDGLASGITAICCGALFCISLMQGQLTSAALCATVAGATLGFLRWNFNPAKIFLGDSGSLLLGFTLGLAATLLNTGQTSLSMLLAPVVMVGVPVLDTFAAIVRRSRVGVSIGTPDKGHIHHRLLRRKLGQRELVGVIYAITALLCVFAFVITQVSFVWKAVIVAVLAALALLLGVYLQMFVPVVRKRFDPETGENEVVPIDEVDEGEDYSKDEISSVLVGGVGAEGEGSAGPSFKSERPLRVLAVSQHYWPEPFAIADVCEGLAAMGHDVTVLTGTPNYPDGDIYPGYEKGARASQERNGVHIRRVKLIPRGREVWQRVINYYSFSSNATREALKIRPDYDVVLSFQTSPVMMARPALAYGRKNRVPVLLWCQDLWPESLTVGNIKRTSLIYKVYARVSRGIYEAADVLAVTSTNFSDYFHDVLHIRRDTVYLPQYAEDIFSGEAPLREEYDPSKVNLTFAGNVGVAQAVNTLVEAGHYLRGDDRFALHVVGSGSELETLKKYKDEIGADCVEFNGRHPLVEMPSFYRSSDAMVATFKNNSILGYTLPRKVTSYMAAGRPVIGTVTGEARRVIEEAGCGLCCDPEDPEALAEICRRFADMAPAERKAMGERGRRYYEEHFAKDSFYSILEKELQRLKDGNDED